MRSRVGIALVMLVVEGCSYVLLDRPPRAVRQGDVFPACSTEHTWPYVDIAVAVFSVVGAGLAYTGTIKTEDGDPEMPTEREMTPEERVIGGTAALIEGVLFALSARHGFDMVARCRELQPRLATPRVPPTWQAPPAPPAQPVWPAPSSPPASTIAPGGPR